MTDKDLEPFVALAANKHRAEALREQELEAIARVVATLVPFLESGYAVDKKDRVTLTDYAWADTSQVHLQGSFYRPAFMTMHWLWLRSDGEIFSCHLYRKRGVFKPQLYAIRPWDGEVYCSPAAVLNTLLDWRRRILSNAQTLKADLDKREQQVKHALVMCE